MNNADSLSTIAFFWTLERRDGAGLALTSLDRQISRSGLAYEPGHGLIPASIIKGGLEEQPAEMRIALGASGLTQDDVIRGRWSKARSRLVAADWNGEDEEIELAEGEVGEIAIEDAELRVELGGAVAKLDRPICPATSPECRASLGDPRCRVNMAGRSLRTAVDHVTSEGIVVGQVVDRRFDRGGVRWIGGANCGLRATVVGVEGSLIRLLARPQLTVQAGDRLELYEGCDKRLETCSSRFGNAVNFRGEPFLPGSDLLTRYPGQ